MAAQKDQFTVLKPGKEFISIIMIVGLRTAG